MSKKKNRPAALGNPNQFKRSYDNSYASQRARMLSEFEKNKQISTFYFRNNLGIVHPAGRIMELRGRHNILTSWTYEQDQNGILHRIGVYIYHSLKKDEGV